MIVRLRAATALAVAAFLLGACGGDDDSATAPAQQGQRDGSGGQERPDGSQGGAGKTNGDARGQDRAGGDTSARFTPRRHSDSGGGAQQFRVRGGDNSVQEFGSEAGESDFEQAATALHNFLDARAQGAWAAACSYLAASVVESLRQLAVQGEGEQNTSCAALLARLTNRAALPELRREARRADVGSLRVEGERAFAIYRGLEDTVMALPMSKEDGEWKVASLAGTPLN